MSDASFEVPSVFVVRADTGKYTKSFADQGYVGIGWFPGVDLTAIHQQGQQGKETLLEMYKAYDPEASTMRTAMNVGQIWRFLDELKPGSFVITPQEDSSKLMVGRINGDYFYVESPTGSRFHHRKSVQWYDGHLLRSTLSVPLQRTLASSLTIFQVRDADEFLELYKVPLPAKTRDVALTDDEIKKLILEQILKLTADDFEILITDLLSAIGFEAHHVGRVGDGGIDVKGTLRVYQFASIDLEVQVKQYSRNKIDTDSIVRFRGSVPEKSQAAFVTTSDFNDAARKEAEETNRKKIGLINGKQLVDILIVHYDDLSKDVRDKLNLRKTLIPK